MYGVIRKHSADQNASIMRTVSTKRMARQTMREIANDEIKAWHPKTVKRTADRIETIYTFGWIAYYIEKN